MAQTVDSGRDRLLDDLIGVLHRDGLSRVSARARTGCWTRRHCGRDIARSEGWIGFAAVLGIALSLGIFHQRAARSTATPCALRSQAPPHPSELPRHLSSCAGLGEARRPLVYRRVRRPTRAGDRRDGLLPGARSRSGVAAREPPAAHRGGTDRLAAGREPRPVASYQAPAPLLAAGSPRGGTIARRDRAAHRRGAAVQRGPLATCGRDEDRCDLARFGDHVPHDGDRAVDPARHAL